MGQETVIVEVPASSWVLLEGMAEERGQSPVEGFEAAVGALMLMRSLPRELAVHLAEAQAAALESEIARLTS